MSRIHEALKKAEQERILSSAGVDEKAPEVGEQTDWSSSASLPTEASVLPGMMPSAHLQSDDLRNRCWRPEWRPDPNVNVFFNPALSIHGAEQFRTLRSRLYQIRNAQFSRTVLVTSSIPGEGKHSWLPIWPRRLFDNPIAGRSSSMRIYAVRGCMQCWEPRVGPGLSDYLLGVTDEASIIQHGLEGNLYFIPGGESGCQSE